MSKVLAQGIVLPEFFKKQNNYDLITQARFFSEFQKSRDLANSKSIIISTDNQLP